jgi:hypothetical protein
LFFVGVFFWTIKMPKDHIDHMKSLPFEDEKITEDQL